MWSERRDRVTFAYQLKRDAQLLALVDGQLGRESSHVFPAGGVQPGDELLALVGNHNPFGSVVIFIGLAADQTLFGELVDHTARAGGAEVHDRGGLLNGRAAMAAAEPLKHDKAAERDPFPDNRLEEITMGARVQIHHQRVKIILKFRSVSHRVPLNFAACVPGK